MKIYKKADIEWDQIAKVIIALIALIILIYIVISVIKPEINSQGSSIKDALNFL